MILDLLESLRDVEPINVMIEVMEGYGTTHKFIFLALFMLSLLKMFLGEGWPMPSELERSSAFHLLPPCSGSSFMSISSSFA